jgi:hypothetical protein
LLGYYGDWATSQHGFLYNAYPGRYAFVDDPSPAFDNGVEVTPITGISDSGEIAGFDPDAGAGAPLHRLSAAPILPELPAPTSPIANRRGASRS